MDNFIFRSFIPEDVYRINAWRNDPAIQRETTGIYRSVSIEMEKQWLRDKMMNNVYEVYLAICPPTETEKIIGYTSLREIDYINRVALSGGTVIGDGEYRDGECYYSAILYKLEYAFSTLNLNKVHTSALNGHRIANSMLEALLFTKEGVFRQHIYKHGRYHDLNHYAILRDEYYEYLAKGDYLVPAIIKRFVKFTKSYGK